MTKTLIVTEIYASVQGESSWAGKPCTFIRLTGCPLRCRWCDTAYGFQGGKALSLDEILAKVASLKIPLVELTGGEPLAQENSCALIAALLERGYEVLIETGGSISLEKVPTEAHIIMDIKCPDSGMSEHNLLNNFAYLKPNDEIKFVIASHADFIWAKSLIAEHNLDTRFQLLLSCAWGHVKEKDLVAWILEDPFVCRLNMQLHKYIWSPKTKGV